MKHSDAVALGRCASGRGWSGDCENGEVVDGDLVISKLVVEVDSRFGEYGMCNICVNGTDPLSRLPCATGEYICACPKYDRFRRRPVFEVCEGPAVGRENISQTFGRYGDCTWDKYVEEPWGCWSGNVWKKTGGEWYSTFKGARCGDGDGACTWRVAEVVKVVNKTCSDDSVFSNIEAHDAIGCFDGCGGKGAARNVSSACWVGCFYRTILGADGMMPTGADFATTGVSLDDLVEAWDAPFNSDDAAKGGCPAIPVAYPF